MQHPVEQAIDRPFDVPRESMLLNSLTMNAIAKWFFLENITPA